jgi:glutathione synthase/RimK-type ligase-like ATP-grasp enzyme
VYNKPEFIKNSGSKKEFHKLVDGDENIPKTCDVTEDAIKEIGFPMIAKPAEGHSGIGIVVIKSQKDWDDADHDKLDVYSEYIDKKSEHRFFTFKGEPFFWQERQPTNDKSKNGGGDSKERMAFNYIKRNHEETPQKYKDLIKKFGGIFSDLPYICFDIMEDQDGKLFIIESNVMPGVPFDSTVQIYRTIFKDFYGRDVNSNTDKKLKELSHTLEQKTLKMDGGKRFFLGKDLKSGTM